MICQKRPWQFETDYNSIPILVHRPGDLVFVSKTATKILLVPTEEFKFVLYIKKTETLEHVDVGYYKKIQPCMNSHAKDPLESFVQTDSENVDTVRSIT